MGKYFVRKRIFLCFWWWDMDNTPLGGYKTVSESINKAIELNNK